MAEFLQTVNHDYVLLARQNECTQVEGNCCNCILEAWTDALIKHRDKKGLITKESREACFLEIKKKTRLRPKRREKCQEDYKAYRIAYDVILERDATQCIILYPKERPICVQKGMLGKYYR